ncbi:succinate dehydrogenase cytochrome b560 subunit, mitochondrial-like [Haematobia irritans]|uniref:succinate dehydrogenase cytochrome b560 subunit, mitochondrial-like n=1 Tax=Haematobia irritans TaxID=7368 RepID=UPI003F508671
MIHLSRNLYGQQSIKNFMNFSLIKISRNQFVNTNRNCSIKMKLVKAPPLMVKTYQQKNEALKRVLSPHLTIYKPQLTSMMSITLRMTGFALGILTWTVGLTSLLSSHKMEFYVDKLKGLPMNYIGWTVVKTILGFPFSFHMVAGIRHMLFDTAKLMEIRQFYGTGYVALLLSCIMAIGLGMKTPSVKEKS